jgi:hypothetical protein
MRNRNEEYEPQILKKGPIKKERAVPSGTTSGGTIPVKNEVSP